MYNRIRLGLAVVASPLEVGADEAPMLQERAETALRSLGQDRLELCSCRDVVVSAQGAVEAGRQFYDQRLDAICVVAASWFKDYLVLDMKELVALAHEAEVRFAYVMTTGLMPLLHELSEAGSDLLYFVDPVQDDVDLSALERRLDGQFALAVGLNSGVTLASGSPEEVREAVRRAARTLGPGGASFSRRLIPSFLTLPGVVSER